MATCCKASCRGHPQLYIWVLVHGNNGHLSVFHWPFHDGIVFPAAEVHGHADVVGIFRVSSIWIDADAEGVALGADKAFTFDGAATRSGGENAGEIADLPNSDGANGLREGDIIN